MVPLVHPPCDHAHFTPTPDVSPPIPTHTTFVHLRQRQPNPFVVYRAMRALLINFFQRQSRIISEWSVRSRYRAISKENLRLERPLARCLNNRPCSLERGSSFEFFNFCSRNILEYFFGNECVISRVFQGKRKLAYVGTGEENAKINRAAFASFYCGSAEFAARST